MPPWICFCIYGNKPLYWSLFFLNEYGDTIFLILIVFMVYLFYPFPLCNLNFKAYLQIINYYVKKNIRKVQHSNSIYIPSYTLCITTSVCYHFTLVWRTCRIYSRDVLEINLLSFVHLNILYFAWNICFFLDTEFKLI